MSLLNIKMEKPAEIDLEIFSRFSNDIEKLFHNSLDAVDRNFRDTMKEVRSVFFDKMNQFKAFNDQIQANHEMITQQYEITQKKLKTKLEKIKQERENWEHEKRLISHKNQFYSDILSLNVGGTHKIMVSQKVISSVPGSSLQKMFSGMHDLKKVDESIFLDRDGNTFQTLVNFLRNDRKIYPEFDNENESRLFAEELNYWGIKDDRQEEKRLETKFPQEIIDMFKIEPGEELDFSEKNDVNELVRQTWNILGPFRLIDIAKNSIDPVDTTLPYGKSIDKFKTQIFGQSN